MTAGLTHKNFEMPFGAPLHVQPLCRSEHSFLYPGADFKF